MKSVSATLKAGGRPIGLLCINLDLSKWEEMHHFLSDWLSKVVPIPELLFKDDWQEKINQYVGQFLQQEGVALKALSKAKKQELIHKLHREGAFRVKHAATYVADVLELSRATVYNYLRSK